MSGHQHASLGNPPKILGRLSEGVGMSRANAIRNEMAEIVQEAAEPYLTLGVKAALSKAARLLGLTPRRAEAYRHGEVRMVPAWEMEELRLRRQALREQRIANLENELAMLRASRREPDAGDCLDIQPDGRQCHGSRRVGGVDRQRLLQDCSLGA
jgi:hypothetical protein